MTTYRAHGGHYIETGDNEIVAEVLPRVAFGRREAIARRIAAALNATEGIPIDALEGGVLGLLLVEARRHHDECCGCCDDFRAGHLLDSLGKAP